MYRLKNLSPEEATFLRRWIYDEAHYAEGLGPAKRLQVEHCVCPADVALLIAAAMPDPADQESASFGPPPHEAPIWPWHDEAFEARLAEAKAVLSERNHPQEVQVDRHGA
jgi:hypothetical protein